MPVLAKGVTESLIEIGLIVAAFSLSQMLSEVYFGRFSDRTGSRLPFIKVGFATCAAIMILHYFATDSLSLILARFGAGIAVGIMIPATMAYAFEMGKQKSKFASVVSFYALGWFVGIIAAGIANDDGMIFLASAGFFAAGFIISFKMPAMTSKKEITPNTTKKVFFRNTPLLTSLLVRHTAASSMWTIIPILLMEQMGAEFYHLSIVFVFNTLTSFVLMNIMEYRLKFSNVTKFQIGIGSTVFVFVGLAFITEWWMAIPFMTLIGLSWGFMYLGGNTHLMENNPKSTAAGMFNSILSIGTVIGPIIGGYIAFEYGYIPVLYFAIALTVCAFAVSARIPKKMATWK